MIRELALRDARKKAMTEDMARIYQGRANARTAAQTAWDLDTNQYTVARAAAEAALVTEQGVLDTARATLVTVN
jgi:hypothetical protein